MILYIDIASEFKEQLQALIPYVLNPSKLMEKEINGSKVTCRGLLEYFKVNINFSSKFRIFLFCFVKLILILVVFLGRWLEAFYDISVLRGVGHWVAVWA